MTCEKVLVIAAHPDDEILGCGGTIARHSADGDEVKMLIVAEGATSRSEHRLEETELLRAASVAAALRLGVADVESLGLPDNRLDSLALLDVVQAIESVLKSFRPTVVYTHHYGDLNIDHAVVARATATAARPLPGSSVQSLLMYEVVSSTGWNVSSGDCFVPSWFVDITPWMAAKMAALAEYAAEMRQWPHARSMEAVEALAVHRGATVGVAAAEAFQLVRRVRGARLDSQSR